MLTAGVEILMESIYLTTDLILIQEMLVPYGVVIVPQPSTLLVRMPFCLYEPNVIN